ncbi:MAG: DUF4032 domain-containing protein [Anaerolineales bacterium]
MTTAIKSISVKAGFPDFLDLPWQLPLQGWQGNCARLEDVPHGLSRHPVVFVNYDGVVFALKEVLPGAAEKEYDLLIKMEELHLPAVQPVGHVKTNTDQGEKSVLVTRYLDRSLPYRSLFMRERLERYRDSLLDAMAGLLVQLHLTGIYWGDCSLSNTLFRRDAGALQAYLVDAETAAYFPDYYPPAERVQDLVIMEENLNGDIADLGLSGLLADGVPLNDAGTYIRVRYQLLWEQVTREDVIHPNENYRIQERIRALNHLGFSVKEVELDNVRDGNQLRLRVVVTDRNFHRDQLHGLTGLEVEEGQARLMMNEIQELKATLSQAQNRSTPLSVAAYYWLENIYQPTVKRLRSMMDEHTSSAELYCQLLEHKWYLSEQAHHDVGHQAALDDYLERFSES